MKIILQRCIVTHNSWKFIQCAREQSFPTEVHPQKVSEFLDYQLKRVMPEGMTYIKYLNDFLHEIRDFKDMPADPLLITADNVWFYPNILHETGLQALKEALERRKNKKISTNNLVEMAAFVLKNNHFEFNEGGNHQIYQGLPLIQNLLLHMVPFLWRK